MSETVGEVRAGDLFASYTCVVMALRHLGRGFDETCWYCVDVMWDDGIEVVGFQTPIRLEHWTCVSRAGEG